MLLVTIVSLLWLSMTWAFRYLTERIYLSSSKWKLRNRSWHWRITIIVTSSVVEFTVIGSSLIYKKISWKLILSLVTMTSWVQNLAANLDTSNSACKLKIKLSPTRASKNGLKSTKIVKIFINLPLITTVKRVWRLSGSEDWISWTSDNLWQVLTLAWMMASISTWLTWTTLARYLS